MRVGTVLVASLAAASALAPTAYDRLAGARLTSVESGAPVVLPTWQSNEKVVVEFLRHFG